MSLSSSAFRRSHVYSYRDYKVGEFAKKYKSASPEEQVIIRQTFYHMESGRLADALSGLHRFPVHLDSDEIVSFKSRFPELVDMVNEWATVEDLRIF